MNKTIIIAEAGVNHNGDVNNAFRLVDVAKEAGVDYVKFQTFSAKRLVSNIAKKAHYQISNSRNKEETQLQMLQKLELSTRQHRQILDYCTVKDIRFFSTAFYLLKKPKETTGGKRDCKGTKSKGMAFSRLVSSCLIGWRLPFAFC